MRNPESNSVGAYEAKTRFSQLLSQVAAGEEITITRHGHPVARLVPATLAHSTETRRAAIAKMRELAGRNRLDGLRVRDLVAQGRK